MKLKFGQNNIDLLNNHKASNDIKIVFSFDTQILIHAKNHLNNLEIGKYDDLSNPGNTARIGDGQVVAVSLGDKEKFTLANYIKALSAITELIKNNSKIKSIGVVIEDSLSKLLNQTVNEFSETSVFHLLNNLYYYDALKTRPKKISVKSINFITIHEQKSAIKNAVDMADGIYLLRDLAHGPSNIVNPAYLAQTAKSFEKISKKVKVNILEEKDARKLKMNTFLAVAQGSDSAAKFIKMEYFGAAKNKKPIVLVGKGITFDTGGITLKPGPNMEMMKYDMCGAATVISIFRTVAALDLGINLVGLVPSCENMPSGHALKPGDVITTMNGKTVEIPNTDAEGRLILCDALTYAAKYKPELVIDIATLTGACIIALGNVASALYSNDENLAAQLTKSGLHTNDKVWRMPLYKEYHEMLKGNVADLSNIGGWKNEAGSVVAACFLEQFTDYKWAHLDIAGTAMGGTGRPFHMMMNFLRSPRHSGRETRVENQNP